MARSSSKPRQAILGAAGVLGAVVATTLCLFVVGDGERAVVTSFGRPVQVVTTPGLGVKLPYESASGLAYSVQRKAIYVWRAVCGMTIKVPSDSVMRYD